MWYQFNYAGQCVSTCTGKIAPMPGIISVWCDEVYSDIENVYLIDGKVVHKEDTNAENIIPNA